MVALVLLCTAFCITTLYRCYLCIIIAVDLPRHCKILIVKFTTSVLGSKSAQGKDYILTARYCFKAQHVVENASWPDDDKEHGKVSVLIRNATDDDDDQERPPWHGSGSQMCRHVACPSYGLNFRRDMFPCHGARTMVTSIDLLKY